jgi:hypothetical protein
MIYMLCRNLVSDFAKWKKVFDSHAQAHREAGLKLKQVWRSIENPDNVFFLFEVTDRNKAATFIQAPEAEEAGRASGVMDGEYHFIEDSAGY